jgi:hypothetical protein
VTAPALKLKVSFRSCRRGPVPHESRAAEPTSLARQIALAHFIEERIESGELASYAEAAERFGLTRARLSQVVDRILLAPTIQEAVLLGSPRVTERGARAACAEHAWGAQVERVLATQEGAVGGGDRPCCEMPRLGCNARREAVWKGIARHFRRSRILPEKIGACCPRTAWPCGHGGA